MTEYSPAPAFGRLIYSVNGREHVHQVNLTIPAGGTPDVGDEVVMTTPNGEGVEFSIFAAAYYDLVKPMYHTSTDFSRFEYWSKPTSIADPVFITAHTISGHGTSSTSNVADAMLTVTARTRAGHLAKFVFMESIFSKEYFDPAPIANANLAALMDYIIGVESPIIARDNSRVFFPLRGIGKASDALRKRRLGL